MTNEEKNLLLKELCTRLPYGVKVKNVKNNFDINTLNHNVEEIKFLIKEYNIKPYLRPMSSMTVEEICKIEAIIGNGFKYKDSELMAFSENVIKLSFQKINKLMEFFYQRHIDVNGLIPMGLALDLKQKKECVLYKNK